MDATQDMLVTILALVIWTLIIEVWMYATRLPAMHAAGVDARLLKRKDELDVLPLRVKQIADNFNHLHEQPVVFYALVVYSHLAGVVGPTMVGLAWSYVALRVVHSIIQCTFNFVPVRFLAFTLSSAVLAIMAGLDIAALTG